MSYKDKTPQHIKIDEKNYIEEPFLKQPEGFGWTIKRLEVKEKTAEEL